jgi:coenzyme F420-0:L-glutamate ligase/coenzyme F420-1:gamma-L-glutamate ligase
VAWRALDYDARVTDGTSADTASRPRFRAAAVIPVRALEGAKARLGEALDAEERRGLVEHLLRRTVEAARGVPEVEAVAVVSADPAARALALAVGAIPLSQPAPGLNEGLELAGRWARGLGMEALLVVPADLPAISAPELRRVVSAAPDGARFVVLVPDRSGDGTNLLLVRPPDVIRFRFGEGSRRAHADAARRAGGEVVEVGGALGLDLDTPDDLLAAEAAGFGEALRRRPAADAPRSGQARPAIPVPTAPAAMLTVLPLAPLPEVRPGDDLPALVAESIAATPGARPLRDDDVVVVTSKVVAKAEGAFVDLRAVVPRPEAVEFAARWKRDARQVEVVLQQAVRVVRMDNGVVIVETRHGFVLANAGVDASNVGPGSGDVVLLLPEDPDASAVRIREAIRSRFGVAPGIVVSDSLGRPWRFGITDLAIGVAGFRPLEDLRGTADADGRTMAATVRAVADEIASAAELVLGKTAGRPAALVRGASPPPGDGSIRGDVLMPPEVDLFR